MSAPIVPEPLAAPSEQSAPDDASRTPRFTINPVLARELRQRTRSRRTVIVLALWLVALTLVLALGYQSAAGQSTDQFNSSITQLDDIGRGLFGWLLFVMMGMVGFVAPSQTAGAIAGERERQTLVPLQVTLLHPLSILTGKLGSSLAYLVLLLVMTLPVLSVAFLIGGVEIVDVVLSLGAVMVSGVFLGSVAVAISAFSRRVQGATVVSLAASFFLAVGPFMLYGMAAVIDGSTGDDPTDPPEWLVAPSPLVLVAEAAGEPNTFFSWGTPWDGIASLLHPQPNDAVFFEPNGFGPDQANVPMQGRTPYWLGSLGTMIAIGSGSLLLGARRLRAPAEAER